MRLSDWGGDKKKPPFKSDKVCSDSGVELCSCVGTFCTWEVTLWCYQELVCLYKVVTAAWEHLIALFSWSKSGPFIISRMFGPSSLQEQEYQHQRNASYLSRGWGRLASVIQRLVYVCFLSVPKAGICQSPYH